MIAWAEVNGASLRYELRGDHPDKPTIVLVHEGMGALESWDEGLPCFDEAFNVLRYDQRGFGMSEKTDSYDVGTLVEDLVALLDFLGISKPVYMASCGFGGGFVLAFAIKHPGRVAGVFVASPTGGRARGHDFTRELAIRAELVDKGGTRALEDRVLLNSYQEEARTDRERFQKFRLRWMANSSRQMSNFFRMAGDLYLVPQLSTMTTPVVIAGCSYDMRSRPAEMEALAKLIPGSRFVEINSGHFAVVQTPQLFAETAVRWLVGSEGKA